MIVSPSIAAFSLRSFAVLRSVGAWMTIAPEQTYVATSIRGLGVCKSTYLKAERRDVPARAARSSGRVSALLAAAVAVSGLLSGFTAHRMPAEARDMAEPDQLGRGIADCQKSAASVSSGAGASEVVAATPSCDSPPVVAAAESRHARARYEAFSAEPADAIGRVRAGALAGVAGG